jgi:hypothetical protein
MHTINIDSNYTDDVLNMNRNELLKAQVMMRSFMTIRPVMISIQIMKRRKTTKSQRSRRNEMIVIQEMFQLVVVCLLLLDLKKQIAIRASTRCPTLIPHMHM